MSNIFKIMMPFLVAGIMSFIAGIILLCLKKPKKNVLVGIMLVISGIAMILLEIPYYKDINQQRLEVYTGEFNTSRSVGTEPFTRAIVFDTQKVEFKVPTFSDYIKNMEEGKEYKVTYYVNTRVVYSIELIE